MPFASSTECVKMKHFKDIPKNLAKRIGKRQMVSGFTFTSAQMVNLHGN